MAGDVETQVTQLLDLIREGDAQAGDRLFEIVYNELRAVAGALQGSDRQNTLQPTALVHEAWIKLAGKLNSLAGRRHFFATASRAMRQVLADHARGAKRLKRGGHRRTVVLDSSAADPRADAQTEHDLLDLNDKLTKLEGLNDRYARVLAMRLLGSMTLQEIADELQLSKRTVESDWNFARTWLRHELGGA